MSQTIIEKFLKGAEVEWKTLEEVTRYEQPNKYVVQSTNYDDNFATPVLTAGKTFILGYTDDLTNVYQAAKNPVIIFDDFTTDIRWVDFDFKIKSTAIKLITSSNNGKFVLKYIYYWLKSLPTTKNVNDHKRQWISIFSKKIIPIPPLSVQKEIVRILDAFTAHTAELTSELNERKKQYNYYRDKLLTFSDDEVEWKTIEEIFTLKNGYTPSKSVEEYWIRGTVPWFRMEDLRASGRILNNSVQKVHIKGVKGKLFPKNSIIMATTATIGEHALITVEHLCNQQFTNFVIKKEYQERLNIKFAYYYFFIIDQKAKDNISISSFPSVQMTKLKKWLFPIPPLSVQKEIVRILDSFSTLTTSISEGLPREIELRNKQYEYYRDQLLNFPKPGNDAKKHNSANI